MVTRLPSKIIAEVKGSRLKVRCGNRDYKETLADVRRNINYKWREKQ